MKLYNVLTIVTPLLGFGLAHLAPGDFYPGQITGPLDGAYSDFKEVLDLAANLTSKNAEKNVGVRDCTIDLNESASHTQVMIGYCRDLGQDGRKSEKNRGFMGRTNLGNGYRRLL